MKRTCTGVFGSQFADYIGFTNSALMHTFDEKYKNLDFVGFEIKVFYNNQRMNIDSLFISHLRLGSGTFFYDPKTRTWMGTNDNWGACTFTDEDSDLIVGVLNELER